MIISRVGDSPQNGDADASMGPTPVVAGRERIRQGVRAALFGLDDEAPVASGADPEPGQSVPKSDVLGETGDLPERLGRFRLLDRLGHGGMGVVFSAYDPELDRKVAIKVLRPELGGSSGGSQGSARLMREAQAMARLTDPHVITVHEVGTFADRVFVAMEFVEGETLADWIARRPPWREVLAIFIRAGSGLAAAHAAGLVHRDFKPDNVLMGHDGRVRVVDFGLARATPTAADPADTDEQPRKLDGDAGALSSPLTRTGAVMGTPAFMSPEQHLGSAADARSDQFSFCVALYEGLYGQRPFAGSTLSALSSNVLAGNVLDPPAGSGVPRSVEAAVRRGLSRRKGDRFESMGPLLEELRRDPLRAWRRVAVGATVAAIASAATYAIADQSGAVDACADSGDAFAQTWNETRRANARTALMATGAEYSSGVWTAVENLIDAYARKWIEVAGEACAASLVDAAGAEETYERRKRCLASRRAEAEGLVSQLESSQEGIAVQAVQAAASLSDIGACVDPRRLSAWRAPRDAAAQRRLSEARATLAAARVQGVLGRYNEAVRAARVVEEAARELDEPATEAAALLLRGQYEERAGDAEQGEATLRRAVERAEVADDHGTRAWALIRLVYVVSRDAERYPEAKALAGEAAGVLRVVGADRLLRAKLDNNLGAAARKAGELDEALQAYEASLAIHRDLYGESHPDTALTYSNIGLAIDAKGEHDRAEEYLRRSAEELETLLPGHPLVASALSNLAINLYAQDRHDEALALHRRALEVRRGALGEDHQKTLRSMYNVGSLLYVTRRYEEAASVLRRGLVRSEADVGADDPSLRWWWLLLGQVEEQLGNCSDALPHYTRLLELKKKLGESGPDLAQTRFDLARCTVGDDPDAAVALAKQALADLEAAAPPPDSKRGLVLVKVRGWVAIRESLATLARGRPRP